MGEKGGSCSRILQGFYKLTSNIHCRTLYGIDKDSKRLGVQCDFSQDLAHAQAGQSMCEYFDIISSSLFIAIAHFWDPVTKKRECEGTKLTIVLYISSSTRSFWCMQQNNVCFLVCQVGFCVFEDSFLQDPDTGSKQKRRFN